MDSTYVEEQVRERCRIPGGPLLTDFISAHHLATAWSGVLVFDSAVFGLTVYRTLRIGRSRLATVLIRDGVYGNQLHIASAKRFASSGALYFVYDEISISCQS